MLICLQDSTGVVVILVTYAVIPKVSFDLTISYRIIERPDNKLYRYLVSMQLG